MIVYLRLLPFGVVKTLPFSDPYWAAEQGVSIFAQPPPNINDSIRTVQLNSTTFSWIVYVNASIQPKIAVRVPIFLGGWVSVSCSGELC